MVKKEKIFPLDFFNQWKVSESLLHNFPLAAFCKVASDWIGWIFNHSEPSPSIKRHICIDWCSLFKLSFNHFPNFCQLQLDIGFIPLCSAEGVREILTMERSFQIYDTTIHTLWQWMQWTHYRFSNNHTSLWYMEFKLQGGDPDRHSGCVKVPILRMVLTIGDQPSK